MSTVGESDDDRFGPLSFSFERLPRAERAGCQHALEEVLNPAGSRRVLHD
jgi:hypothetical protein